MYLGVTASDCQAEMVLFLGAHTSCEQRRRNNKLEQGTKVNDAPLSQLNARWEAMECSSVWNLENFTSAFCFAEKGEGADRGSGSKSVTDTRKSFPKFFLSFSWTDFLRQFDILLTWLRPNPPAPTPFSQNGSAGKTWKFFRFFPEVFFCPFADELVQKPTPMMWICNIVSAAMNWRKRSAI